MVTMIKELLSLINCLITIAITLLHFGNICHEHANCSKVKKWHWHLKVFCSSVTLL